MASPGVSALEAGNPTDHSAIGGRERVMLAVQRGGSSYVSNARVNGKFALRGCVLNYRTTRKDMEVLLEDVRAAGRSVV